MQETNNQLSHQDIFYKILQKELNLGSACMIHTAADIPFCSGFITRTMNQNVSDLPSYQYTVKCHSA
jgi:hypothetical protein